MISSSGNELMPLPEPSGGERSSIVPTAAAAEVQEALDRGQNWTPLARGAEGRARSWVQRRR